MVSRISQWSDTGPSWPSWGRKHCGKGRKCWLPAVSSFPGMFTLGFLSRIVTTWYWAVNKELLIPPQNECLGGVYWNQPVSLSVCLRICLYVRMSTKYKFLSKLLQAEVLTLFQTSLCFYVSAVHVFWKHWEKEKLLILNNFSFSLSVFYTFGELSAIFIRLQIVICKLLRFGRV